jgi:class 3 adenylate cyclase/tetratricopeptide (TPR) repeat protein
MSSDRRHLTILNCDIVNSTFYADRMDPEDFESLLTIFYETCKPVVESRRGVFAHHTGDGFTAYFGSPRTLGRDAQEAITCGRALIEALDRCRFPGGVTVQVRIGIATGLVVVSTVNRQNNVSESFAVGAPLHLAARIQAISPPGRVSVDDTSYRLAERNFTFTDFGNHMLKGFAEPTHVWQVDMPREVEFRFDERQERLSPFVGRTREMAALDHCRLLAAQGLGQTVLITGEAGIGKSRLVFEGIERMAPAHSPLVFQCLEELQNEPLHPWINYARHAAKVISSESLEIRRRKAGEFIDRTFPTLGRLRPFVQSLVAQDSGELHLGDDDTPAHKLDALRAAIVERIVEPDSAALKVVVVEDIHWIDPSSDSLLMSLIERASRAHVLMLVTGRKDKDFGAAGRHVTHLAIDRLNAVQAVSLASHMMQGAAIADTLLAQVIERSDGIPLYIEEMVRTVSETGRVQQLAEAGPAEAGPTENRQRGGVGLLPIPDALQGTLLARLDGLGESRQLAQIASVVGREFAFDVLAKLAGRPKDAVERDLSRLVDAGLVRLLKSSTETKFEFRHALIREAAYNSLLRRDAVELHSALARLYEADYPEMGNARPELLAQHLTMSGRWLEAASLWLRAGILAREMGSSIEALTRLDRCLECLESAAGSREAQTMKMRCQMARGALINDHFGPVEQGAHRALAESADLAEALQDADAVVESLTSLAGVRFNSGDFPAATAVARRMIQYGARHGNERASAIGMVSAGMCSFATGRFNEARVHLEEALVGLSRGEGAESYEGHALVYLAFTLLILGNAKEANNLCAVAIEQARQRRTTELAAALGNSLYLLSIQGDVEQTRRTCNELQNLAEEKGFPMWFHQARFFLGWANAAGGDRGGLEMMEAAMDRFREAHELVEQSFFYGLLAERYLGLDLPERALENVERGLRLVSELGEKFFEAPLLRLKARCLSGTGDKTAEPEIAELFDRARQLAIQQGAVAWR